MRMLKNVWILLVTLTLLTGSAWADPGVADIICVDKTASGTPATGENWTYAYNTIAEAVADVDSSDDEIWVAGTGTGETKGVYTLTATISVSQEMGIYGGFDGTENQRDERDRSANPTVINGNDSVRCFAVTASATIDGFIIKDGNAGYGAGMDIRDGSSPTIKNCIFYSNRTVYDGGSNPGGAAYVIHASPTFENCAFIQNSAYQDGGAISCWHGPSQSGTYTLNFINCTFYGNQAGNKGGAISLIIESSGSNVTVNGKNCIFYNNSANYGDDVYQYQYPGTATFNLYYCSLTVNSTDCFTGTFNRTSCIYGDPKFTNRTVPAGTDGDFFTSDDGLRLSSANSSPCIDKGNNSYVSSFDNDILGNARRIHDLDSSNTGYPASDDPYVDMGAYEYVDDSGIIYVDTAVNSTNATGQSWANPFDDIQSAIDAASASDEIWVADGTYTLASQINADVAADIYGGFQGNSRTGGGETLLTQRNYSTYTTTISGNNACRCLNVTANATIDGFTIQNGSTDDGGGLYITSGATEA